MTMTNKPYTVKQLLARARRLMASGKRNADDAIVYLDEHTFASMELLDQVRIELTGCTCECCPCHSVQC